MYKESKKFFEGFSWINDLATVNNSDLNQVLKQAFVYLNDLENCKIVHNNDWINVFSNDLSCYDEAYELSSGNIRVSEAVLAIPRGCIACRTSQHKYRIYLRHTLPTKEEHDNMRQFVKTYKDHIFQSKVFSEWVADNWNKYRPLEYYFYFETNDINLATMLDLTVPGLKSRVCRVISDKYNTVEE